MSEQAHFLILSPTLVLPILLMFFADLIAISSVVNSVVNCVFILLCPFYDGVLCLLTDL